MRHKTERGALELTKASENRRRFEEDRVGSTLGSSAMDSVPHRVRSSTSRVALTRAMLALQCRIERTSGDALAPIADGCSRCGLTRVLAAAAISFATVSLRRFLRFFMGGCLLFACDAREASAPETAELPTAPDPGDGRIVCSRDEVVERTGVRVEAGAEPAIVATGRCRVTCIECELAAANVVVAASGSAVVTLVRSRVRGSVAIDASGEALVTLNGTDRRGAVRQAGSARVAFE